MNRDDRKTRGIKPFNLFKLRLERFEENENQYHTKRQPKRRSSKLLQLFRSHGGDSKRSQLTERLSLSFIDEQPDDERWNLDGTDRGVEEQEVIKHQCTSPRTDWGYEEQEGDKEESISPRTRVRRRHESLGSMILSTSEHIPRRSSLNPHNINIHRSSIDIASLQSSEFEDFVKHENIKAWLQQFKRSDPRYKILNFFNDVAQEGATTEHGFDSTSISPLLRAFYRSSVFTVWRPTSKDAIRRMMLGEGVGKGLDIKGKSAKKGKLSGFVPFLQIHEDEHKTKIRTLRKDVKIRIYFETAIARDSVLKRLAQVAAEMQEMVEQAKEIADDPLGRYDEQTTEAALSVLSLDMEDPTIDVVDSIATGKFGMDVPERLLWEGMVMRQSIDRAPDSDDDIGRPSMPAFQDMNFGSLRKNSRKGERKVVIMQYSEPSQEAANPLCPLNLVMAYEETNSKTGSTRIIPVVSDFDCFMVGTRGVKYEEPLPIEQIEMQKWCIQNIEAILEEGNESSWTERWLDTLKTTASDDFHAKVPSLGYGDPKTNFIFKHAIDRLSTEGAVRHGAECFNYQFPQDLDEQFLIISDDLPGKQKLHWQYANASELQGILKQMIHKGYTFPLNPKWILADNGWKEVYDQLIQCEKPDVQSSLRCWYSQEVRDMIENVHSRFPNGFQRQGSTANTHVSFDGTGDMDLAEQALKSYMIFQRARRKLKAILIMRRMLESLRRERLALDGPDDDP